MKRMLKLLIVYFVVIVIWLLKILVFIFIDGYFWEVVGVLGFCNNFGELEEYENFCEFK